MDNKLLCMVSHDCANITEGLGSFVVFAVLMVLAMWAFFIVCRLIYVAHHYDRYYGPSWERYKRDLDMDREYDLNLRRTVDAIDARLDQLEKPVCLGQPSSTEHAAQVQTRACGTGSVQV